MVGRRLPNSSCRHPKSAQQSSFFFLQSDPAYAKNSFGPDEPTCVDQSTTVTVTRTVYELRRPVALISPSPLIEKWSVPLNPSFDL
jgi:hypothetical protein